jgi:serine protease Do
VAIAVLALGFAFGPAAGQPRVGPAASLPAAPASFAPVLANGLRATVVVYGLFDSEPDAAQVDAGVKAALPLDRSFGTVSLGSGFFIARTGLIVTAAHVVNGAARVVVMLDDQRSLEAVCVGQDVASDIALLRVPVQLEVDPPLGESVSLRAGDWVLAVGDPYGTGRSVVAGIVGGRPRHFPDDEEVVFIQTDLALNPGNSGGPLLDAAGRIVGMNTRMMAGPLGFSGLSLSIPIEIVQGVAAELGGAMPAHAPRLGARFYDVPPPLAVALGRPRADGALVGEVSAGGAAARLGLQPGDIVVAMNGKAIGDGLELAQVLMRWRSERGTTMAVFRAGRYRQLRLP